VLAEEKVLEHENYILKSSTTSSVSNSRIRDFISLKLKQNQSFLFGIRDQRPSSPTSIDNKQYRLSTIGSVPEYA